MPKSNLRKLRKAAGLSMRELASRLKINHSNVRYWETTNTPPRSNLLLPMAKILGVSVEELLGSSKKTKKKAAKKG